jgi:hypothetical protein
MFMNIGGTVDIGAIDDTVAATINLPAGPIRIPEGVAGASGFGLLHVESNASRMKQIGGLGYACAIDFMVDIARNWTEIRAGDNGRIILIKKTQGYGLRGIVGWTDACWSMTTAIPGRTGGKELVLFSKATVG